MGIFNHKTTNQYIGETNSYNKYFFITAYYKNHKTPQDCLSMK